MWYITQIPDSNKVETPKCLKNQILCTNSEGFVKITCKIQKNITAKTVLLVFLGIRWNHGYFEELLLLVKVMLSFYIPHFDVPENINEMLLVAI